MCCILNDSNKGELSWQKSLNLSNFLKNVIANNFWTKCARKMADPILEMANETQ